METLKNKVAIITGSSAGIGEGTAVLFAKLGCHLTLTGRDQYRLKAVVQRCVEAGCPPDKLEITDLFITQSGLIVHPANARKKKEFDIVTVIGNIQDKAVRQELLDKTLATFGRLDILVNNAGLVHVYVTSDTSEEDYDETMDVNMKAVFFLSKLAAPELIKTKGSIVNVSSRNSQVPTPLVTAYCMSKTALDMFTQCLALELAPSGVRVNSVNPGVVPTMVHRRGPQALNDQQFAEFLESQGKIHPLGRVGQPAEIANTIAFLASDMSSFTTGTSVYVDGGLYCVKMPVCASSEGK